ncbi:MAG: MFS transporter [Bacteroidota bacterium]
MVRTKTPGRDGRPHADLTDVSAATVKRIPRTVWALGFVSLFMDVSSEMIHSLLPVFLVSTLHVSAISVGLIEGVAEAIALTSRSVSGTLSDRLRRRKGLTFVGYAFAAATKPLFALATGATQVFAARSIDRLGKGIRGAPRDALIADASPEGIRGAAYGLRQSLDSTGAVFGPLLAMILMLATGGSIRVVFWAAVIPAALALGILAFAVRESPHRPDRAGQPVLHRGSLARLGSAYWFVVAAGSAFVLARFSEAFLLLRAHSLGLAPSFIPLVFVILNVAYALTAYPFGRLSDRFGRRGLLAAGLVSLIFSDLTLALADTLWHVALGTALWGLHMGLTQGLLAAMVADVVPHNLRGTAFGIFGMTSGMATLFASLAAGALWASYGPPATFLAGASMATAALIGFLSIRQKA